MCEPRRHFAQSCLTSAQFTEEQHRNHMAPHNPHDILHGAVQALFLTNFVEIFISKGSPGWNAWEPAPAGGSAGGIRPGAPYIGQGQVLGVGLPWAAGRALPQGARLLEDPRPPSVVSQYLAWTGTGLHLPAEGTGPGLYVRFHCSVSLACKAQKRGLSNREVGALAALRLGGGSAGTHAWKAWSIDTAAWLGLVRWECSQSHRPHGELGSTRETSVPDAEPAPVANQQPGRSLWETCLELVMWGWLGLVPPFLWHSCHNSSVCPRAPLCAQLLCLCDKQNLPGGQTGCNRSSCTPFPCLL